MVRRDDVAVLASDRFDKPLEFGGIESGESPAHGALQMVMMRLEGAGKLVLFFPANMDDFDDPECFKYFERTVNTSPINLRTSFGYLTNCQRLLCLVEQLKYINSRPREAKSSCRKKCL